MVEQLSVKQCVVGSSPTILSFGSSICLDSLLAVRSTGLKNRRVVVRLHLQAPYSRIGDYLLKTLSKRPTPGTHVIYTF